MYETISSAYARVIWNGDRVGISSGLRRVRGVTIHWILVPWHRIYLYILGDVILWSRDISFWRGREGKRGKLIA